MRARIAKRSRPRRGKRPIGTLLTLFALVGGTQAVAPPPVAAMTSQELAAICFSVFGDPSMCLNEFKPGGGTGGGAPDSSGGGIFGVATQPEEEIVITEPKPPVDCGFGIWVPRPVDCPRKPGDDDGIRNPPQLPNIPAAGPIGLQSVGPLKKCFLAEKIFEQALKAKHELAHARVALAGDAYLRDARLRRELWWDAARWQSQLPRQLWKSVFGTNDPVNESGLSDQKLVANLEKVWMKAVEDFRAHLRTPVCANVRKSATP